MKTIQEFEKVRRSIERLSFVKYSRKDHKRDVGKDKLLCVKRKGSARGAA